MTVPYEALRQELETIILERNQAQDRVVQLELLLGVNQRGWDKAQARVAQLEEALREIAKAPGDGGIVARAAIADQEGEA